MGVLLGEHDTKTNPDCEDDFCADSAQYIKAASYSIPDDYDELNYAHDILLIKLAHRAQFNGMILIIHVAHLVLKSKLMKSFAFPYRNRLCYPDMLTNGQ